ncbi:sigma-70 family RNA polymerase sigma factor [Actinoplanes sp. NPDC051411]|uniref:sigma-70 family RNA polymerase sigma factor n=1 Tax=Actinoplanes sp. NPDC051411 TaxID=3155522 RepID=UPI00341DAA88
MHASFVGPSRSGTVDLDVVAADYARAWHAATIADRRRLREDLIRRLLPFADRLASRYRERAEPMDDLRQVARLALIAAVDRYDPDAGSFTAFAVATIRGEIKKYFRDSTWSVHVTRRLQELSLAVSRAEGLLTLRLTRRPTSAEVAADLQVSEADVQRAQLCLGAHTALPLSTPTNGDQTKVLGDLLADSDNTVDTVPDMVTVDQLVRRLPEPVQRILALRFHGDLTQAQIAEIVGVSQMHVSRLLTRSLTWLRTGLLTDTVPLWDEHPHAPDDGMLRLWTAEHDGTVTVVVSGEVDRAVITRFRVGLHAGLARAQARRMLVDLSGTALLDVAGAAVLRDLGMAAGLSGTTVVVTGIGRYAAAAFAAIGMPVPAGNRLQLGHQAAPGSGISEAASSDR